MVTTLQKQTGHTNLSELSGLYMWLSSDGSMYLIGWSWTRKLRVTACCSYQHSFPELELSLSSSGSVVFHPLPDMGLTRTTSQVVQTKRMCHARVKATAFTNASGSEASWCTAWTRDVLYIPEYIEGLHKSRG